MQNIDQRTATKPQFEKKAREAVENYLKIDHFIETHKRDIFKRLEDCHDRAEINREGDIRFIAEVLPFVNAIVHVGSSMGNFKKAKRWIDAESPDADAVSILSALTFLYIVDKGFHELTNLRGESENIKDKSEKWQDISKRTKRMLFEHPAPDNQPEVARPTVH